MTRIDTLFQGIVTELNDTIKCAWAFGYWPEVANDLALKGKSVALRENKYPVIFMDADFERKCNNESGWAGTINPTFYILANSNPNDSSVTRLDGVFNLTLRPLEDMFITLLRNNRNLGFKIDKGIKLMDYESKDLFYITSKSNLNDVIDGIRLTFKEIKIKEKIC